MAASKSTRRLALEEMVNVLKTIDGGVDYFRDLTVTAESVTLAQKTIDDLVTEGNSFVTVMDGEELIEPISVSDREYSSRLDIVLVAIIKEKTSETAVEELNDLIRDVHIAIGSNPTLNGVVDDARVIRLDPPAYDLEDLIAGVAIHVEARYTFTAGTTI